MAGLVDSVDLGGRPPDRRTISDNRLVGRDRVGHGQWLTDGQTLETPSTAVSEFEKGKSLEAQKKKINLLKKIQTS